MDKRIKKYAVLVGAGAGGLILGAVIGTSGHSTTIVRPQPTVTVYSSPAPAPTVTVTQTVNAPSVSVAKYSGTGDWDSSEFTLDGNMLTVTYSYSGNSDGFGGSNFVGDIESSTDDQNFVNTIGTSGSATTHAYPTGTGAYHLSIEATGSWTVTIAQQS
jgi:hypothetical protein